MAVRRKDHRKLKGTADELKAKIIDRSAIVAVVGAGYVGLPLAVEKTKVGFKVIAVDQNEERVAKLNRGENYILDVRDQELRCAVQEGLLRATSEFTPLSQADVIIICVPTPLTVNREPDLRYVINVTEHVAGRLRVGQLVCLESTTYPGTTEEIVRPRLEGRGLRVGEDFFLVFSPERVDPGNARYTTKNTNKLIGGVTPSCLDVATTFYSQTILSVVGVSSPSVAEMAKVFENTYRAVNIALVNEMALLCDRMGLDVWEILGAAFTKPFGIQPFYPGPGVGGHCIPTDPFYLAWKAREYDFSTRFIELAGEVNMKMPYFVVDRVARLLGQVGKPLRGSAVLLLGIAYKKDVPDYRQSPAVKVLELLLREGARVAYHDPMVSEVMVSASVQQGHRVLSVPLSKEILRWADVAVITTDHSRVDYKFVLDNARMIFDTRNAMVGFPGTEGRVVRL